MHLDQSNRTFDCDPTLTDTQVLDLDADDQPILS